MLSAAFADDGSLYTLAGSNRAHPYAAIGNIARLDGTDLRTLARRPIDVYPRPRARGRPVLHPHTQRPAFPFFGPDVLDWDGVASTFFPFGSDPGRDAMTINGHVQFGDPDWTDLTFEFDCRRTTDAGHIAVPFRCAVVHGNFMLTLWRDGRHRLEYVIDDGWRTIAEVPAGPYRPDFRVRIDLRGDRIECRLDGELIFAHRERLLVRGGVGLGSVNHESEFRNVRVTAPDGKVLWQGPPLQRYECPKPGGVAYGPDGTLWASLEDQAVVWWRPGRRGPPSGRWEARSAGLVPPASNLRNLVAGNRAVTVGARDGALIRLSPEGRFLKRLTPAQFGLPREPGPIVGLAPGPDERTLLVAFTEAGAWRVDPEKLSAEQVAEFSEARIVDMAVSADGDAVVLATSDDQVHVYRLPGGPTKVLTLPQPAAVESVAVSADGGRVAVCLGGDHSLRVFDLTRLEAACREMLAGQR